MKLHPLFLLTLSAVLYSVSFFWSAYCWWLIIFFPIPLLFVVMNKSIGFWTGYFWGLMLCLFHSYGLLSGIFMLAQGLLIHRIILLVLLIMYVALPAGILFWMMSMLARYARIDGCTIFNLILWLFCIWLFFYWIDTSILWPFNEREGYCLMHPLVPLVMFPSLLGILPQMGTQVLSWCLYGLAGSIFLLLCTRTIYSLLLVCIMCLPWVVSLGFSYFQHALEVPDWISRVAFVPIVCSAAQGPQAAAQQLQQQIRSIISKNASIDIIIMPESACAAYTLLKDPSLLTLLSSSYVGRPVHIIMGSFRSDGLDYYNCVYWIYNGRVQCWFDKRHVVPFIERMPVWCQYGWMRDLFFAHSYEILPSHELRLPLNLALDVRLMVYICSEFFFRQHRDDVYTNIPILCLVNDVWVPMNYVADLILLAARFKAMLWQCQVMFVSFTHAAWIDAQGIATLLT
jgi:predicted amidohydrolase